MQGAVLEGNQAVSLQNAAPRRLAPGYYIVRVSERLGAGTGALVVDSAGGVPNARTFMPLRFGRLFLLRVIDAAFVGCPGGHPPQQGGDGLNVVRLPRLLAPIAKLFRHSRLKLRIPLLNGGYVVVLSRGKLPGSYHELRAFQRTQCGLAQFGLHDANIPNYQMLDSGEGWLFPPDGAREARRVDGERSIAVVLHLYYGDLWPEISAFLSRLQRPFELIVTYCCLGGEQMLQIRSQFPRAQLWRVENRGRDVWPFIALLNEGSLSQYSYICKIHSKKSAHVDGKGETLLGLRWRRRTLCDLLGGDRVETILQMFENDPKLGLVGCRSLRLPTPALPLKEAWGSKANFNKVQALARRMGAGKGGAPLDFFAGSMFWVRPQALEPFRRLNLARDDFGDERGQLDGELQHAIERLFPFAVRSGGFRVADVPPLTIPPGHPAAEPLNAMV
jgi:hypothetical protein